MKIAVVCTNGKAGQLIVKKAVNRCFDVTAFVKGENKSVAQKAVIKDIFDLTADDLKGFDAAAEYPQGHGRQAHCGADAMENELKATTLADIVNDTKKIISEE